MRFIRWLRNPEYIGPPDCPIMRRWTIYADDGLLPYVKLAKRWPRIFDRKLMVHYFEPNVEDRDPHDHPRGFWTLVLRGRYLDLVPCGLCDGSGRHRGTDGGDLCSNCLGDGLIIGDVMKAGTIRYRPAKHTHITQSGPKGAWTLILMGPFERSWGFLRNSKWWPFKEYEAEFGFAMRCPSDEEREGVMLKYSDEMVDGR